MRNLYPSRKARRDSLCELRWRELEHVDAMARSNETIDELHAKLLSGFTYFYGPIRKRRRDDVPSDATRRIIKVFGILALVEERRREIEAMPKPSAAEMEAALAAAPNEYMRALIELYPESVAGRM